LPLPNTLWAIQARHPHASLLISEGVRAKKIAERLGHASIKLTMDTYGHLFEGSDQESAERMDRIFKGG
jgi:integrase